MDEILCARSCGAIFCRPRANVPGTGFCPEDVPDTLASVGASGPFSRHIPVEQYIRSQIRADQGQ